MNRLWLEKFIPELRSRYQSSCWIHAHPFSWPMDSLAPFKNTNRWVQIHWYLNVTLAIGYFGFVAYRTVEAYSDPNLTLDHKLYLLLLSVVYGLMAFYSSAMLLKSNEFIQFQRSHVKFIRDYMPRYLDLVTGEDGHHQNPEQTDVARRDGKVLLTSFKLLLRTGYFTCRVFGVGAFILNVAHPTSGEFLSSLLLDSSSGPLRIAIMVALSCLIQLYLLETFISVCALWMGHGFLWIFTVTELLHRTTRRKLDTSNGISSSCMERNWLQRTLRLYKCLNIQTNLFNNVTAALNGVAHANNLALIIMYVCGAARLQGILALASAYLAMLCTSVYCKVCSSYGEINRASRVLLKTTKRVMSARPGADRALFSKIVRSEIRSMKELRVMAGTTFYFDKSLVLTVVEIILCQSVNLLIM